MISRTEWHAMLARMQDPKLPIRVRQDFKTMVALMNGQAQEITRLQAESRGQMQVLLTLSKVVKIEVPQAAVNALKDGASLAIVNKQTDFGMMRRFSYEPPAAGDDPVDEEDLDVFLKQQD